jgi:hypothetical protein
MTDKPDNVVCLDKARLLRDMNDVMQPAGVAAFGGTTRDVVNLVGLLQDEDGIWRIGLISPDNADIWQLTAGQTMALAKYMRLLARKARELNELEEKKR